MIGGDGIEKEISDEKLRDFSELNTHETEIDLRTPRGFSWTFSNNLEYTPTFSNNLCLTYTKVGSTRNDFIDRPNGNGRCEVVDFCETRVVDL